MKRISRERVWEKIQETGKKEVSKPFSLRTFPIKDLIDMEKSIRRILVVDDDVMVLSILSKALEGLDGNSKVVAAHNGEEALKTFKAMKFDLVITDLRMPGRNGIELAKAMHALEKRTPVILFTAFGSTKLADNPETPNIYRCLSKPMRIGEIRQAARDAMSAHPL